MYKRVWTVAKINLRHWQGLYAVTIAFFLVMAIQTVVLLIFHRNGTNVGNQSLISAGNMLWLLPFMAGIAMPAHNFRRIVNLGGKRENFFWGSLCTYAILAAGLSLANSLIYYLISRPIIRAEIFMPFSPGYFSDETFIPFAPGHIGGIANLMEVFGWTQNGAIIAFLQQFAFLFLLATFIHTLTAIQGKWYGWFTNAAIIAIISVFTPIAPLRRALVGFFNLILTHETAAIQIAACIVIGLVVYMINKPLLARKVI